MSDVEAIAAIIKQYENNGWKLRRVLATKEEDFYLFTSIGDAEVVISEQNALWFSRRSKPDAETWELRRLKGMAFALLAIIDNDLSPEEAEEIRNRIESDMMAGPGSI